MRDNNWKISEKEQTVLENFYVTEIPTIADHIKWMCRRVERKSEDSLDGAERISLATLRSLRKHLLKIASFDDKGTYEIKLIKWMRQRKLHHLADALGYVHKCATYRCGPISERRLAVAYRFELMYEDLFVAAGKLAGATAIR